MLGHFSWKHRLVTSFITWLANNWIHFDYLSHGASVKEHLVGHKSSSELLRGIFFPDSCQSFELNISDSNSQISEEQKNWSSLFVFLFERCPKSSLSSKEKEVFRSKLECVCKYILIVLDKSVPKGQIILVVTFYHRVFFLHN